MSAARRFTAAVVLIAAFAVSSSARADELEDFQLARNAYDAQSYALAVQRFESLVGGEVPRLTSRPLVLESRKYLAAAYLFMRRPADAERQFERLLREDETYELDPVAFPTEVLDLFTTVKNRLERERRETEHARTSAEQGREHERAEHEAREHARAQRLMQLAETETVERVNSRWIAAIPFGVGQFQNGDRSLGLVLAVSEGVLLAAYVTSYLVHASLEDDANRNLTGDDLLNARTAEQVSRVTNWISFGLLIAVAATGVIEAQMSFEPVTRTTRRRPLPPDLRAGLHLSPTGLEIRF